MNEIEEIKIENLIYEVRGKQVMLDSDVAKAFGYTTKDLNRNVRNNINRFPEDYCFKLTEEEYKNLRCKNFTSSNNYGGRRYLPYVFTEHGITMLSGILKSEVAVKASIKIVNTFISMRKFINENKDIFRKINNIEIKMLEHDSKIDELFDALEPKRIESQKIFFNGEIYDSYSLIIELIKEAIKRIIIVDNYIDKSILDMLVYKQKNVDVSLVTSSHYLTKLDIDKFNKQYPNLKLKYSNVFHDRFMVIDDTLYHIGASLKDLGKKCFGITKIEDKTILKTMLKTIEF